MMRGFLVRFLATGAGTGYSPVAPGTAGTLLSLCLYLAVPLPGIVGWACLLLVSLLAAVGVSSSIPPVWGHDPSRVVIDEMVGLLFAVAMLPRTPVIVVGAFILFRAFDIVKPPPARAAERLPGGWGIVLDDVIAGVYAHLALRGIGWMGAW